MYTVLNELSIHADLMEEHNHGNARNIINLFVEILHRAKNLNEFDGLITTTDIYSFNISKEYGIQEWLKDSLVEKKYKDFLRVFFNKRCSFIETHDYPLSEFIISLNQNEYNGIGCLVATEMSESVVSLQTHHNWSTDTINGSYLTLDDEGTEIKESRNVNNISKDIHFDHLTNNLTENRFKKISSGQDLWEEREVLFPNLVFCESVKAQLYNDPEKFHVEQVIKKLMRIQQYFSSYDGLYDPKQLGFNARTESETVKSNPTLKSYRLFEKPDGSTDYFYNHIGFTGKYCGRIHFFPDDTIKKCFIGYIGKHLPTKNF